MFPADLCHEEWMKTVKRILAVFGLIFFLFAISYLVYTAKEVDFDEVGEFDESMLFASSDVLYEGDDVVETNMQVIDQHIRERRSKEYAKKNHS